MIRILIADDHTLFRDGMRRLLTSRPDLSVVGEAGTGDEVLEVLAAVPVDVVLLDIEMPGRSFADVLRVIAARHPTTRVVVLSGFEEDDWAVTALRAGALGFVSKGNPPVELFAAIAQAAEGRRYVSPHLAELLAAGLAGEPTPVAATPPSPREQEVLRLLGAGRTLKEIGGLLGVSPKTVSTYRARLLEKLGLRTTADLIRHALTRGAAA